MGARRRRIGKRYLIAPFDIEDGLSTYDLQLLALAKQSKSNFKISKNAYTDQLVA